MTKTLWEQLKPEYKEQIKANNESGELIEELKRHKYFVSLPYYYAYKLSEFTNNTKVHDGKVTIFAINQFFNLN